MMIKWMWRAFVHQEEEEVEKERKKRNYGNEIYD